MADLSAFGAMAARAGVVPRVPLVPRENEACPTFSGEKPHAGAPLPIAPDHVRAAIARELRHLSDLGIAGPEAERRAVAIVAGKIRNSAALAERQAHDGRCHHCGEPLDDARPVVAVLRPGGGHYWLHGGGCREAFGARRAALVAWIMATAGYGAADLQDGRDGT